MSRVIFTLLSVALMFIAHACFVEHSEPYTLWFACLAGIWLAAALS